MKRILFIAYHFPPILGSSGYLRSLKFIRYLPTYGFEPIVLTVNPRAYPTWNDSQLAQIPAGTDVHRAFALDAQRHLSFRGRYLGFTSLPDRFSSWIPGAIWTGLRLIQRKNIDLIFSTYPIPSAHLIGNALARLSGKPWLADFRDPMWDENDGPMNFAMKLRKSIEAKTMQRCSQALVCTDGMASVFRNRYGALAEKKVSVIPNGFDEKDFEHLRPVLRNAGTPVTFMHAGLLEQVDRDPVPFFRAVKLALQSGRIRPGGIKISLLGTGNNGVYVDEIARLGLEDVIKLLPPLPYAKALEAMAASDVLLLFQGPGCNPQIPAKFYEYLRLGKPILAVTTHEGETGRSVLATESGRVVAWDDPETIAMALSEWATAIEKGIALPVCSAERAGKYSRQTQAQALAEKLSAMS